MHRSTSDRWTLLSAILALLFAPGSGESEGPELIFSDRVSLIKMDLQNPSKTTVIVDSQSNAVAVDYDIEKNLVVWSDVRVNGIYSANIGPAGGAIKVIAKSNVVTPDGLAVDWIYGNLYWTDTGTDTLSVASLDGTMRKVLFDQDLNEPRAIVVNPLEGWMFWTDWGRSPKIERSGMDGTLRTTIVSKDIAVPNGLAIDFESRKLFWADVQLHALRSCDYDGSNVKKILFSLSKLGHPFAVDVFGDWLYWTDWRSHSVTKVNKNTGENMETVTTKMHFFPMGIRVYHAEKQPKGVKYCGEGSEECLYLCVRAPHGKNFACLCPDETDCRDRGTVTAKSPSPATPKGVSRTAAVSTSAPTDTAPSTSLPELPAQSRLQYDSIDKILQEIHENVNYCGRFAGLIFGTFVLLIVVVCAVAFYVYKQNLRGNLGGLRFVNPAYRKAGEADKSETGVDSGHDALI